MADSSLLPVIVGGLIGLAGGVVGPWFLQKGKDETEKKKHRAEKFEELVTSLYEHNHWLGVRRRIQIFDEPGDDTVSPFVKVQAISTVYFPELKDKIRELDMAVDAYELWIAEAAVKREENPKSAFADGFKEAHGPYTKKFVSLLAELREYAAKEFQ